MDKKIQELVDDLTRKIRSRSNSRGRTEPVDPPIGGDDGSDSESSESAPTPPPLLPSNDSSDSEGEDQLDLDPAGYGGARPKGSKVKATKKEDIGDDKFEMLVKMISKLNDKVAANAAKVEQGAKREKPKAYTKEEIRAKVVGDYVQKIPHAEVVKYLEALTMEDKEIIFHNEKVRDTLFDLQGSIAFETWSRSRFR